MSPVATQVITSGGGTGNPVTGVDLFDSLGLPLDKAVFFDCGADTQLTSKIKLATIVHRRSQVGNAYDMS
jgi:hypothetical protein